MIDFRYYKAFAGYAKDESDVLGSSSGGFSFVLAKEFMSNGGVVYGAVFDEDFHVVHKRIDNEDMLEKTRGSKYVRSFMGEIHREIIEDLNEQKKVLFFGTPCQCQSIKRQLETNKIDHENLLLVDIICHGTPLELFWDKYLKEKIDEYESKPIEVNFRSKKEGWYEYGLNIRFENGKSYYCSKDNDPYMQLFLRNLILAESCYECRFKGYNRASDITMADFWSVYRNNPKAFNANGTSLILSNSVKGQEAIHNLREFVLYPSDLHEILRIERAYSESVKRPATLRMLKDHIDECHIKDLLLRFSELKFFVYGSFNVRAIANRTGKTIGHIGKISALTLYGEAPKVPLSEGTGFRAEMALYDNNKGTLSAMIEPIHAADFIVIDLLDERFGYIENERGERLTYSDALMDQKPDIADWRIVDITDNDYLEEFSKAVDRFASFLETTGKKVIVIELFLAKQKYNNDLYEDVGKIEGINDVLKKMYSIAERSFSEYKILEEVITPSYGLHYTEKNHKHGQMPENLNARLEINCSTLIREHFLKSKETE